MNNNLFNKVEKKTNVKKNDIINLAKSWLEKMLIKKKKIKLSTLLKTIK